MSIEISSSLRSYQGTLNTAFLVIPSKLDSMTDEMEQSKTPLPLEDLSFEITRNAVLVSQYLHSGGFPQPSHEADGPSSTIPRDSPQNIREARQNLIEASLKSEFLETNFLLISSGRVLSRFHRFPYSVMVSNYSFLLVFQLALGPTEYLPNLATGVRFLAVYSISSPLRC